jgi:glutaminyl-peptide cyclotransferase
MPGSIGPSLASLCALLLALAAGCSEQGSGATPPPERADRPAFRGDQAFGLLQEQVAFGPRIPGSEGHRRQLEWMRGWLAARADTVISQPFQAVTTRGDTLQLTNLFARFHPDARDRVLLVAHWDTRPRADQSPDPAQRELPVPGANDGASGTAVLLQLAEMLRRHTAPLGVDLLLVDGEDFGPSTDDMFLGSRHFASNLPPGYRPLYGVLLDMVADRDPRFPVERYSQEYAPEVVQRVWSVASELGYGDVFVPDVGGYVTDDHLPLNQAGIRTIDIIDFDYGPGNRYWHTPQDVPENTSPETLRMVGEVIAELVYRGG